MNLSLLDYLRCVNCAGEHFTVHAVETVSESQIVTGYLTCQQCQAHFPIVQGVLIAFRREFMQAFLLKEEIEVITRHGFSILESNNNELDAFLEGQRETHKNWSFQWLEMDTKTYEQDWGNSFGDLEQFHYYDIPIDPEQYDEKVICEASCGFGRVIQVLHKRVSRYIAFDLSGAVYKAVRHFPNSEKLDVIRADMLNPPFKQSAFTIFERFGHHGAVQIEQQAVTVSGGMADGVGHILVG